MDQTRIQVHMHPYNPLHPISQPEVLRVMFNETIIPTASTALCFKRNGVNVLVLEIPLIYVDLVDTKEE